MMVALLLYCYATGTRSSRRIMRRCQTDVACRVIVGEHVPDFRTISDFRKTHLARVGTIALDGTKIKVNASRHKKMSYDRMKEEEKRLNEKIARLMAEDEAHGRDRRGDETPAELKRRESRLAKILEAKVLLEERAWAEAVEEAARRQAEGKQPPANPPTEAVPKPKTRSTSSIPNRRPFGPFPTAMRDTEPTPLHELHKMHEMGLQRLPDS